MKLKAIEKKFIISAVLFVLFFAGCGVKPPTNDEVVKEIKTALIKAKRERISELKKSENESIKKYEKKFTRLERQSKLYKRLFEKQNYDGILRAYSKNMETLKVLEYSQKRGEMKGKATYENTYGSKFEVFFKYTISEKKWKFDGIENEYMVFMSEKEKIKNQKDSLQNAINLFLATKRRYPKSLKELVPDCINEIPAGNWNYNPKTGVITYKN